MESNALLNARELAGLLSVDVWTIRRWASMRKLPSIKLSARCVRYDPEQIRKWISTYQVESKL
jgi:predicted DNA-binding transcriptional regulator AlpA